MDRMSFQRTIGRARLTKCRAGEAWALGRGVVEWATMILKSLVVADPVGNIAELVTTQCRRLASQRVVATTGTQTLALVSEYKPEVLVVSLELARPPIEKLVPKLIKIVPDVLIVASFRELAVPKME